MFSANEFIDVYLFFTTYIVSLLLFPSLSSSRSCSSLPVFADATHCKRLSFTHSLLACSFTLQNNNSNNKKTNSNIAIASDSQSVSQSVTQEELHPTCLVKQNFKTKNAKLHSFAKTGDDSVSGLWLWCRQSRKSEPLAKFQI